MYQLGEVVLYGTDGVFRVDEVTKKKFGKETGTYYVLRSVYRESSVIYIPVGNEKLEAKMHPILSEQEVDGLIAALPGCGAEWVDNENDRKLKFKEILTEGNRLAVAGLIRTLNEHQRRQESCGKKIHISDERFLKDAERVLYDEIAYVKQTQPNQVKMLLAEFLDI